MKKLAIIFLITLVMGIPVIVYITTNNDNAKDSLQISKQPIKENSNLSIMLEQNFEKGDYKQESISEWPSKCYTYNAKLSKCENGSQLSWDDENKMVLMESNQSDKCYVYFDKCFEFTLDDNLYQISIDTTWDEWLNSEDSNTFEYKNSILIPSKYDTLDYYKGSNYGYGSKVSTNPNEIYIKTDVYYNNKMTIGKLIVSASERMNNYIYASGSGGKLFHSEGICMSENFCTIEEINKNEKIKDTLNNSIEQALLEETKIFAIPENEWDSYVQEVNNGKYYSAISYVSCLSPETLIEVIEEDKFGKKRRRKKKLKNIKVGDKVICINPYTLELDIDTVTECDASQNKTHTSYDNWIFSDGTIITTIYRHRFYNIERKKFIYMDEWNIGEHSYNIEGNKIELIKHEHIEENIHHCTLFTQKYNNYFANSLLSGNRNSTDINL